MRGQPTAENTSTNLFDELYLSLHDQSRQTRDCMSFAEHSFQEKVDYLPRQHRQTQGYAAVATEIKTDVIFRQKQSFFDSATQ